MGPQCIDHITIASTNSLTAWLPIGTTALAVFGTYLLATFKKSREDKANKCRALEAEPKLRSKIERLIKELRLAKSPATFRDVSTRCRGTSEFAELATKEAFTYANIDYFEQFVELKRINHHFRDDCVALVKGKLYTTSPNAQQISKWSNHIADDIENRMKVYYGRYKPSNR